MVELRLRAPDHVVDAASDALLYELGALSVTVADAEAGAADEEPLFGEPGMPAPRTGWRVSTLAALFDDDAAATGAVTLLLAQPWADGIAVRGVQTVPDEDWVRLTQAQFGPVQIAPAFWVVPSWAEPPDPGARNLRLDPGLAFGTGTHATTRMCLRWIAARGVRSGPGARVLDYGCGSGILAITAAFYGAGAIDAVDIDPAAVAATRANAAANGVTLRAGLPDVAAGGYDLVLANILAAPLTLLAPLLCRHLAPGGRLVLAGLLARQADALRHTYAPWCAIDVADEDDGWALMTGQAPQRTDTAAPHRRSASARP